MCQHPAHEVNLSKKGFFVGRNKAIFSTPCSITKLWKLKHENVTVLTTETGITFNTVQLSN